MNAANHKRKFFFHFCIAPISNTLAGSFRHWLNALFFCFFFSPIFSQNKDFNQQHFNDKQGLKTALKNIGQGDKYYNQKFYQQAIEHYLKAQEFNPDNAFLNIHIGECYLNSSSKHKALPYLEKAIELKPGLSHELHFLLAQAYHLEMQWDKAIAEYEKFIAKSKDEQKNESAKKKVTECNNGKELVQHPVKVKIENIGKQVNSEFPEYCPLISADESVLLFTSRRNITTGGKIDSELNVYYEDIYISKEEKGKWGKAVSIGQPVNTEDHDATVGLSPDGQKLFIFKNDDGDGNIYECDLHGTEWSPPKKLNQNINSSYHEPSASFSYDGKTIYFVSNRPGGFGGTDIYLSQLTEEGGWGEAQNLGNTINTAFDEEAVFMHPDGKTLYFSSKGYNTMGGYDIFKSVFDKKTGKWPEPENIGYPINTPDDDVFFVIGASGKHGYYSSFQASGQGEKDLYRITFLRDTIEEVEKEPKLVLLKGRIVNDEIPSMPIEAEIEVVDLEKNEVVSSFTSNSSTGNYLLSLPAGRNYGITVAAEGYFFHSEHLDIPESAAYEEKIKDMVLKKIDVGKSIVLNNIFFDFDKATLRHESKPELGKIISLLNENPSMRIEISGHTDNKGTYQYNKNLSQQRAKSVVDYLSDNGVNAPRLEYAGYAFDYPIAANDTEEGRQKNRRTEFKVLDMNKKEEQFAQNPTRQTLNEIDGKMKAQNGQNSHNIPTEFIIADKDADGIISSQEIILMIDAFFDGNVNMTAKNIIELIDFYFEQ